MAVEGIFKPKNSSRYRGDPNNIIFRSSYELRLMQELDRKPNIIQWSSEEFFIPYFDPVKNRNRRYFPDFWVKYLNANQEIVEIIIEIKPHHETVEPVPKKTKRGNYSKRFLTLMEKWITNSAKWKAARLFCEDNNMEFKIFTEYELGLKKRPNK